MTYAYEFRTQEGMRHKTLENSRLAWNTYNKPFLKKEEEGRKKGGLGRRKGWAGERERGREGREGGGGRGREGSLWHIVML